MIGARLSSAERQIGSGQDYAICGTAYGIPYAAVMDGHGSDQCIDFVRSLNFDDVMTSPDPAIFLHNLIKGSGDTFKSGFTFTCARVVDDIRVQVWNVGDSETHVFGKNGEHIYKTPTHTFSNNDELERTRALCVVNPVFAPFPISSTRIENILSPVGVFHTGENLALSMAYGHNNMTGFNPSFWEMDVNGPFRIVCGSDGLHDMLVELTGSADEMVDEAARRWQMDWMYFDGKTTSMANYAGGYDDVSVAVIEIA